MIEIKVTGIEEMRALLKDRLRTDPQTMMAAAMDDLMKEALRVPALNHWPVDASTGYLPSMLADGTFYPSKRRRK